MVDLTVLEIVIKTKKSEEKIPAYIKDSATIEGIIKIQKKEVFLTVKEGEMAGEYKLYYSPSKERMPVQEVYKEKEISENKKEITVNKAIVIHIPGVTNQ